MKFIVYFLLWIVCSNPLWALEQPTENAFIAGDEVSWSTLGNNENDSMPIGNGDLAANVWTEQNGDIVLLLAKSDAWSGLGQLLKLGRIRVSLTPNPFVGSSAFTQVLEPERGAIEIKSGNNEVRIWIDANHPVVHVEAQLEQPGSFQASLETWRTKSRPYGGPNGETFFEFGGHPLPLGFEPDTLLPNEFNRLMWCHYNTASVYPLVFQQEHLESLLPKYPDPLLDRCFGASMSGPGLSARDDQTLKSSIGKNFDLNIVALTMPSVDSTDDWKSAVETLADQIDKLDLGKAWQAHQQWWMDFWNRSWIHLTGSPDAEKVSQGYAMQRYMIACSSRGAQPVKFNGGLFTVGHDLPEGKISTPEDHDPDFRQWGNCFWNQNIRLIYWPLIASGDTDLLKPWFDMYVNDLPLATDRTKLYYQHDGAAIIETTFFWGLPNLNDFGWDNPSHDMSSGYMAYHIQGTLEVIAQMLDSFDSTQDAAFARSELVPFATAITTYYSQHWPRDPDGKIRMFPAQSLETYQRSAVNPTPDIAGLKSVLPRLLALPGSLISQTQKDLWTGMLRDLPPIPLGKTANGKSPPFGKGDDSGTPIILPAEKYGETSNSENPELYVAFPYHLYGVGKPGLDLARATFAARLFPQDTCWGQDGTQAAVLGITDVASKAVVDEFTAYGPQRFPWFWRINHDWIPDMDNGGSGMITLQQMLMQCDGQRIQLLPAWPSDWTADFKLHAPFQTTVEGHVEGGKITSLKVTPGFRQKDIILSNSVTSPAAE
jgi:alpha-L-fucosidase 2